MKQNFACVADAKQAADKLSRSWKYHCLESVAVETHPHYNRAGRPTKNQFCEHYFTYRVTAQVVPLEEVIEIAPNYLLSLKSSFYDDDDGDFITLKSSYYSNNYD